MRGYVGCGAAGLTAGGEGGATPPPTQPLPAPPLPLGGRHPACPTQRAPPSVPHPAYLRERGSGGDQLDHPEVEEVCSLRCGVVRLCGLSQLLGGGGGWGYEQY